MLILSIILLIFSNAVNNRQDSAIFYNRISLIILFYSIYISFNNLSINFLSNKVLLYNSLLKITYETLLFSIFIFIVTFFIVLINSNKTLKLKNNILSDFNNILTYTTKIIEYPLIILFCITGACLLMFSNDLITIFIALELQSYGLYLLCSINRDSEKSVSAGLTYFLLGGLSSCIILFGLSYLYINSGNTNLDNIYTIKNIYDSFNNNLLVINDYWVNIQYSLILISVGFLFKISSAPFHFWSPDVYDAIPTLVTTFVAIIAKISILMFLLELTYYTSSNSSEISWINVLLISSILSLIIGSLLGLVQYRIKRLYAYSTISHVGFILLALSINTTDSIKAFYFYIIQYSLSNLNAFILLIAIGYILHNYIWINKFNKTIIDKNNSPVQLIVQLKGLFTINPFIAISLAITLFSFIGVPPLVGFFGKQMILSSAINNGYIFISLIGILTSVISGVYYLVIVKTIFFENSEYIIKDNNITISSSISITIALLTLSILLFMWLGNYYI